MAAGDSSTTQGSTTSGLPAWLQPYGEDLLARGQALTGSNAAPVYGGTRVAGLTPGQTGMVQSVSGLNAGNLATQGSGLVAQGANYAPSTGAFGIDAAQQYMSPYQQSVTDYAKQAALLTGQQGLNKLGGTAALGGAYGGSRFGLEQAQMAKDIGYNVGNIQAQGSQNAYQNAQQQFNADQARGLQAGMFNQGNVQQANLANMGAMNQAGMFGASAANTAAGANQAAMNQAQQFGGQNWMTAQQAAEQSRQFGNDAALRGADLAARTGLSAASQYQNLGTAQQQSDLERLNALSAAGTLQQQNAQQNADVGYQNFLDSRDFQKNNLTWMNNLIRGTPAGQTQTQTAPQPSSTNQALGLGLGALGAYRAFSGG